MIYPTFTENELIEELIALCEVAGQMDPETNAQIEVTEQMIVAELEARGNTFIQTA